MERRSSFLKIAFCALFLFAFSNQSFANDLDENPMSGFERVIASYKDSGLHVASMLCDSGATVVDFYSAYDMDGPDVDASRLEERRYVLTEVKFLGNTYLVVGGPQSFIAPPFKKDPSGNFVALSSEDAQTEEAKMVKSAPQFILSLDGLPSDCTRVYLLEEEYEEEDYD